MHNHPEPIGQGEFFKIYHIANINGIGVKMAKVCQIELSAKGREKEKKERVRRITANAEKESESEDRPAYR